VTKRLHVLLSLCIATLLGVVIGLYAQSSSAVKLAKLSEEKAEISKMDLVLLNTRVSVLQQMLKDDLSFPFTPTNFSYDADKKKIRVSVYVDSAILPKMSPGQLTKALETRSISLCVAPELADGNLSYMFSIQPPNEYCTIRFFTHALDSSGHIQPKDVATFEDGKLSMK